MSTQKQETDRKKQGEFHTIHWKEREVDPIGAYLRSFPDHEILTKEEEIELAKRIEQGDSEARETLMLHNVGLVLKTAKRYNSPSMDIQDFAQEGFIGLMEAIDKFDYRKGFRFSTYAMWWIRQKISRSLEQSPTIRIPINLSMDMVKVNKEQERQDRMGEETPTAETIGKKLGMDTEKVDNLLRVNQMQPLSLDATVNGGEEGENSWNKDSYSQNIQGEKDETPSNIVEKNSLIDNLNKVIDNALDYKEMTVLRMRFGLDGEKPSSLRDVGKKLGISGEWVRQSENKVLKKIRESEDVQQLQIYLEDY